MTVLRICGKDGDQRLVLSAKEAKKKMDSIPEFIAYDANTKQVVQGKPREDQEIILAPIASAG